MLRVLPGLVAGVVLAASAGAVVQSGQAPPPARDAVAVDFYLIGSDRRPITDLKPEETTVRIDGRPRKISALQLVTVASPPAADVAAPAIEVPPPPFATNTAAESGRTFILVFDDESIRPGRERPLRAAVGRFLGSLTPRDRVSLLTVPHGGMKVDLTNNHDRISRGLRAAHRPRAGNRDRIGRRLPDADRAREPGRHAQQPRRRERTDDGRSSSRRASTARAVTRPPRWRLACAS